MNNDLTLKEKQKILKNNGWYQLWTDDNWLQTNKHYSNPDMAGMSTEQAYQKFVEDFY
jgi:hypothetical protein